MFGFFGNDSRSRLISFRFIFLKIEILIEKLGFFLILIGEREEITGKLIIRVK